MIEMQKHLVYGIVGEKICKKISSFCKIIKVQKFNLILTVFLLQGQMKSKISQTRQNFQYRPIFKLKSSQLRKIFTGIPNFPRHCYKSYKTCKLEQGVQNFNFGFFDRFSKFVQIFTKNAFLGPIYPRKVGLFIISNKINKSSPKFQ